MDMFRSESKLAEYATDLGLILPSRTRTGQGVDHAETGQIMKEKPRSVAHPSGPHRSIFTDLFRLISLVRCFTPRIFSARVRGSGSNNTPLSTSIFSKMLLSILPMVTPRGGSSYSVSCRSTNARTRNRSGSLSRYLSKSSVIIFGGNCDGEPCPCSNVKWVVAPCAVDTGLEEKRAWLRS
jgi:hypothetical protein